MRYFKSAYTLIEISIVLIVLSIVLGMYLKTSNALSQRTKFETTKTELQTIKKQLIGYAIANGKLPLSDVTTLDGVGDSTGMGELPYVDIQNKSKDSYGQRYQYDALDALTTSNAGTICGILSSVVSGTDTPLVKDNATANTMTVAALVISKGEDRVLSGENNTTNRIYESVNNTYNDVTNNDMSIELTHLELYGALCE